MSSAFVLGVGILIQQRGERQAPLEEAERWPGGGRHLLRLRDEGTTDRRGPLRCGAAYGPLDVEVQHARVPLGAGTRIRRLFQTGIQRVSLPASGCGPAI